MRISETDNQTVVFTYYALNKYYPAGMSYWNIVGIGVRREAPLLFDLRLLHIEEEMLEWAQFDALHKAYNHIGFNPEEFEALIQFFEALLVTPTIAGAEELTRFRLLGAEELTHFHIKPYWVKYWTGHCYQYLPDTESIGQDTDQTVSLLVLPYWSSEHAKNQEASLSFLRFDTQQLETPTFDPLDPSGISTVPLDQRALEELLQLLKQRTYEHFVRSIQKT